MSRVPKISARLVATSLCLSVLVLMYQNCGNTFQPLALTNAQGLPPGDFIQDEIPSNAKLANILAIDPVTDSGTTNFGFGYDYTPYLKRGQVGNFRNVNYLANRAVSLEFDDAYPNQIANPNEELTFAYTNPKFRQVNTYFHIDRLISSMTTGGNYPSTNVGLTVVAHCEEGTNSVDNAYYDIANKTLCMGSSEVNNTTIWSSEDADVIVHEFGHSLNHSIATTEILSGSLDAESLDEGIADLWAYTQNRQKTFAKWFGTAIYKLQGTFIPLRDLASVPNYPQDARGDRHGDSVMLSTAVTEYVATGVDQKKMQTILTRTLQNMQSGWMLSDVIKDLRDEVADQGLNIDPLNAALSRRGLLRKDDISGIRLSSTRPIYVIDGGSSLTTIVRNGNCNGTANPGETILIYPNVENPTTLNFGSIKWGIQKTGTNPISLISGGETGSITKLMGQQAFTQTLNTAAKGGAIYNRRLIYAVFAVSVPQSTAPGSYTFNIRAEGFNSIDHSPVIKDIPFTLNVAAASSSTSCNETALFP